MPAAGCELGYPQILLLVIKQAKLCSLSPVLRGEGWGEGFDSSEIRRPLTLALCPEYRGEGTYSAHAPLD